MNERDKDIEREPAIAPPARATDPQKPGEPLRPGPQGGAGTPPPAGSVVPGRGPRADDEREGGPDDRGEA